MGEFDALKEGDQIGIIQRFGPPILTKVLRVTPSQIIVDDERRFNKKTGRRVGSDAWSGVFLISENEAKNLIQSDAKEQLAKKRMRVEAEVRNQYGKAVNVAQKLREIADQIEAETA